jgi:hypothetical protein
MSKQSKNPTLESVNFSDSWTEGPVAEWISSYKKYLLYGVAAVFAGLILAYRLLSVSNLNTEGDYFRAQAIFSKFQEDFVDNKDELNELETIIRRHPELQAKYDGPIAQTLLIEGDIPKARVFADLTFNRTRPDHLALFEEYAKTSLVIGEGKYSDALQQATQLKTKLESGEANLIQSSLYAFNLVRLALLNQQLGQKDAELESWAAVQALGENSKAALAAIGIFNVGNASLNQYIMQRKN